MIKHENWKGREIVIFENESLLAQLCPGLGNNLYRLWDKRAKREVLRTPDSPEKIIEKPGHWGTPLMLPPNRIRNAKFSYGGKNYSLEVNTPNGHHIHGFLRGRPWKVSEETEEGGQIRITSSFDTNDYPELKKSYPDSLLVEVAYVMEARSINQITRITNRGDTSAPIGYGLHTWFMIDSEPKRWTLKLPVADIWKLDSDLMPSGQFDQLGKFSGIDKGLNLSGTDFDTVFRIGGHVPDAWLIRDDGYTIRYTPSSDYKHWVIYTMGTANEIVCLEPYTWVTNAPNLDLDPSITGLRAIEPGKTWEMSVLLRILG